MSACWAIRRRPTDYSKHDVAEEGGSSIQAAIDSGDENRAMQIMATGAALLTARLYGEGRFDGMVVLGGTMGTDLALDVCSALPLGVPKYISLHGCLLAADTAGAACRRYADDPVGRRALRPQLRLQGLAEPGGRVRFWGQRGQWNRRTGPKPLIGMTSLGKSALKYMVALKPALEERGFEVAVFHATGMGGRAFESLAAQGAFACVFDFCTQELGNHLNGSNISAGRRTGWTHAGAKGIPQIVAPGCYDLVDVVGWQTDSGQMVGAFATRP